MIFMKIEPMKQPNDSACGPTCIFLAVRYFGDATTFEKIEELTEYKKNDGVTDEDIVKVCNQLGHKTERLLNSSWDDLTSRNTENTVLIVSWMQDGYKGHVSIVDKVDKDHIFLIDSDEGKVIKMEKVQFMRLWMEYDGLSWPNTSADIHLRPLIVIGR
jgi:ABC-type bacteriocin/lantibiotic exporter with double-glycine peptidase domain